MLLPVDDDNSAGAPLIRSNDWENVNSNINEDPLIDEGTGIIAR